MEINFVSLLTGNPILLLFTVIGLGYLVGDIRLRGIQAGPVSASCSWACCSGTWGSKRRRVPSSFGFALFIFSVGIQASPTFFSAFAADGVRYVTLAFVVVATAVALTLGFAQVIGLEHGFSAGMLAGALTTTPTLAGAQDAVSSGLATLPEGITEEQALENISVGYAITCVFGTVGMILAVRFFPRIAGIDLPAEAAKLARGVALFVRRLEAYLSTGLYPCVTVVGGSAINFSASGNHLSPLPSYQFDYTMLLGNIAISPIPPILWRKR